MQGAGSPHALHALTPNNVGGPLSTGSLETSCMSLGAVRNDRVRVGKSTMYYVCSHSQRYVSRTTYCVVESSEKKQLPVDHQSLMVILRKPSIKPELDTMGTMGTLPGRSRNVLADTFTTRCSQDVCDLTVLCTIPWATPEPLPTTPTYVVL